MDGFILDCTGKNCWTLTNDIYCIGLGNYYVIRHTFGRVGHNVLKKKYLGVQDSSAFLMSIKLIFSYIIFLLR